MHGAPLFGLMILKTNTILRTIKISNHYYQFWNYIFTDLMLSYIDFTRVELFFLWISIVPIIFSFMFYHLNNYMQKNEVWKDKNYIIIGKPKTYLATT